MEALLYLGVSVGFVLAVFFGVSLFLLIVFGFLSIVDWLECRAVQWRAAKATKIAEHSVTVEVD